MAKRQRVTVAARGLKGKNTFFYVRREDDIEELAEKHAEWTANWTKMVYKEAFKHGYKHGKRK